MSASHGFKLLSERQIREYDILARHYRHEPTGAEVLSLISPDENKVFGVSLRTPPHDHTGLPHILEHSVLCGSRKYPVKEPFVELLKGSLQTFLNAFTYPDKTCYPVASANLADFYNLVDVYLDAVFHPRIPEEIFGQEGWHLDFAGPDPAFKGVVYNEMKGAYSSPDGLLAEKSQQVLFPDTAYGLNSGGEPSDIPKLTYAQFKDFHRRYYHPANARFFFHGDDDPARRLEILGEYLSAYQGQAPDSQVTVQPRWAEPRRFEFSYAGGGEEPGAEPKAYFTMNWLLPEVLDVDVVLGLAVLEHVLIGLPASPLRKALIDSGLGEDLAGSGLETELRQMYFSTGLKGLDPAAVPQAEGLVLDTLRGLTEAGVDPGAVEAALNTLEFRLRENNTGSFPRGLSLMLRALTTWLHGADPLAPICFEEPLTKLKARLQVGEPVLQSLIREHLLGNPHRATVVLSPDHGLTERMANEESERLKAMLAKMTPEERAAAKELDSRIRRFQETPDAPEALATIPKLHLADLPVKAQTIPGQWLPGQVFSHDLPTNGVIYLDLGFELNGVAPELLPLTPLFCRALMEMGTDREDFSTFMRRVARKTGGIYADVHMGAVFGQDRDQASAKLVFRAKAVPDKTPDLMDLLESAMLRADLDNSGRFRQMLFEAKARAERRISSAGHALASKRLRARFHRSAWADEAMSGLSALETLKAWCADFEGHWPKLRQGLFDLRRDVLRRGNLTANVTLDQTNSKAFEPALAGLLSGLPDGQSAASPWPAPELPWVEGLSAPVQVNYVAVGGPIAPLGPRANGAMMVACRYLRNAYLWERVRVRGGAYGAFCSFDRYAGLLSMLSYRDPNIAVTLEAFYQAPIYLKNLEMAPSELEQAVIGTVGDLDAYQLPDAKGYTALARHWVKETEQDRQTLREQVMGTTLEDLRLAGAAMETALAQAPVVVLGARERLDQAAKDLPGLVITRAL